MSRTFDIGRAGAVAVIVGSVLAAGCAQYATVCEHRPPPHPDRAANRPATSAERLLAEAARRGRTPLDALGHCLDAASTASRELARYPDDPTALATYNAAVARIVTALRDGRLDAWTRPLRVPSPDGGYVLTHRGDPERRRYRDAALYDFIPADEFDVKGKYVRERTQKAGLGAPLVAIGRSEREDAATEFVARRTFYGITALVRFEGRRAVIAFEDPLSTETTTLDGHAFPLAADFTVPLAVMLARENPRRLELTRLLWPERYARSARIVRLQPYDPEKTVVLVLHGLMDTPATWAPMLNALRGDPVIRRGFQFWYFSYPSGYAYPYAAAILRQELDRIEERFTLRRPVVLIGHSMGGLISRLMVTDSGNALLEATFRRPPAQTPLSTEARAVIEKSLIFPRRPEVGRVVFICAPHRGSNLARNWLGRIGSSLIRSPVTFLRIGPEVLKLAAGDTSSLHLRRLPNSIDTLAPNNRFVRAVNTIPIPPRHPVPHDCRRSRLRRYAEFERWSRAVLEQPPRWRAERARRAIKPQRASVSAGNRRDPTHPAPSRSRRTDRTNGLSESNRIAAAAGVNGFQAAGRMPTNAQDERERA